MSVASTIDRSPADEMVLETAVNGGADWLVTFNSRPALEKQLADAKQQVQDIALKAIEGASGAKALSHINQIAMEQAKNRPQG